MTERFLIYGAYGYTGALITRYAAEQGLQPILGGRDPGKLCAISDRYGFEQRVFDLGNPAGVAAELSDIRVVIHCAGPFIRTARVMAEGCLRAGAHYLDITGEIAVFEMMARLDRRAIEAGVMLLPGAGFDVVPSDCLAAHLKQKLPEASHLTLAFRSKGRPSHGTSLTVIENMMHGGAVRKDGKLTRVPPAWRTRDIDFGRGPTRTMTIPWGDVSTAFYSTGIPDIEVYMAAPRGLRVFSAASRYLGPLLGSKPVQRFMKSMVKEGGPSDAERDAGYCLLWGEVRDPAGHTAEARMRTPDGYTLTAQSALHIAGKVLAGQAPPGFKTPSLAYGPDLVLELPGVTRS
jgi:short subunit dehydrogenase-like uncharacterized protein